MTTEHVESLKTVHCKTEKHHVLKIGTLHATANKYDELNECIHFTKK